MFGRAVACAVSVCALWSLLSAGEARAFASPNHRFVSQYINYSQNTRLRPAEQMPVWPPARPSRHQPAVPPTRAGRGGRFGDAFMVDTGVVLGPTNGYNFAFGAASNGDGWRVLWTNVLKTSVSTTGIRSDGSLLDPRGIPAGSYEALSAMEFNCMVGIGRGFMAVWQKGDSGILGATLDSSGTVLDSFVVFSSDSGQLAPAIAFDGDSTCLVVWTESPYGDCDILAARVTISGRVLDPTPIPVADDPALVEQMPSVAFGRGVFLVAWSSSDTTGAMAVRVSRQGTVLGPAIALRHDPASYQGYPAVAFGDTCFLAAWAEGLGQPDMVAARVSSSGTLIDTAGIKLSSDPNFDMIASIGFDGASYLVVWHDIDTAGPIVLCGRRVTADGVALDSGLIRPHVAGLAGVYPSVAADRANFLVTFTARDTVTNYNWVGCVRVSPDGAVLDSGIILPLSPDAQYGPSGASDGTDFLAAWSETRATGAVVDAARIASDGQVLDPAGFAVSEAPGGKSGVATAFGDSMYLVAWEDNRGADGPDIYCARVAGDGRVLDPDGIVVCDEPSDQSLPDVSFDGQNFLVVWQDYRSLVDNDLYAARVSPSGLVLDPDGFAVAVGDSFNDAAPVACFTGTNYLVVWDSQDSGAAEFNLFGALVSPAGTIARPRFLVSDAPHDQIMPAVACGPTSSLVAWMDQSISSYDICAARIRADGTVLDPDGLLIEATGYDEQLPRVMPDPDGFKVLWSRYESSADSTVFAMALVDTAGSVVRSGDWFGLPGTDNGFDAVCGNGPDVLLLFSCLTDTAMGRSYDSYRLWGSLGEVPGVQEADTRQLRDLSRGATIVRGVLFLARSLDPSLPRSLLDISGRKVLDLKPGANDVHGLAPGVYFVRGTQTRSQAVRKVIVAR